MIEINRFLAQLINPRTPAEFMLQMFHSDLAFKSTSFSKPHDPSLVLCRFIDLDDYCQVQFFTRGISDVLVASEDAPYVDIDWTLCGNEKPKEANLKNMWRLFQISYPSDRRIVFRAICNNKAFVEETRPNTSGYFFASPPGDSTHQPNLHDPYIISFDEKEAKEWFPKYDLPLHPEECWVSLTV